MPASRMGNGRIDICSLRVGALVRQVSTRGGRERLGFSGVPLCVPAGVPTSHPSRSDGQGAARCKSAAVRPGTAFRLGRAWAVERWPTVTNNDH